jgi:hypothetical protein
MDLNNRTNQLLAGAVVLVLVAGAWVLGRYSVAPASTTGAKTTQEQKPATAVTPSGSVKPSIQKEVPSTPPSGEMVDVPNQPAGASVAVRSVTLVKMGWVAVRDNEGRILGAARFDEGTHSGVVELLRNTVAGSSYQVLLYVDDGNKEFDLHADILVSEADGRVAGTTFLAQ